MKTNKTGDLPLRPFEELSKMSVCYRGYDISYCAYQPVDSSTFIE